MTSSKFAGLGAALLAGTMLSGVPAMAQTAAAPAQVPATTPAAGAQAATAPAATPAPVRTIKSLRVEGSQRIEPETALSYTKLRQGQAYTNETLDQAIKDLYASDLFADVQISGAESGDIVIRIRPHSAGSRLDARSASRVGRSDLGANARRLRTFFDKIKNCLKSNS